MIKTPIARAAPSRSSDKISGPERAFMRELIEQQARGEILWWAIHSLTLKLGQGLTYIPDFLAVTSEGVIVVYEIKGSTGWGSTSFNGGRSGSGGKSRAKFLAAVESFPLFAFRTAFQRRKKDGGGFDVRDHAPRNGYGLAYSCCMICDRALPVGQFPGHECAPLAPGT